MEYTKTTLGEISIGKGQYGIGASAVEYSPDLYTYLRITDINDDGTLNILDLKSVDDPKAREYLLSPNDIVFARTGNSTGRNYFYDGSDGEFVYAGFLIKFSLDPSKVNPRFIKYYCLSDEYKGWVQGYSTGSTRGNINAQTYAGMEILLPPREQQDNLVKILDDLEAKRKTNSAINRNLEEQAFALFDSYFPRAAFGEKKIGDYIVPSRGKNLLSKDAVEGEVPVIAGGLSPATYHNQSNTVGPVITISASGANAGYVGLWNESVWSSDSSYIDSRMTHNVYFWYVMLKKRQKEIFDSQTGSAQPHIYPKHIEVMPVIELDMDLVDSYTKDVSQMFKLIGKNDIENRRLATVRDTLLPKLMSGELDVSDLDI